MSSNIAVQRIKRELNEMAKSGDISIEPVNNSLVELRGRIVGPPDTPYENGTFELFINAPETYPFNPPKVRFLTRIWHPNISSVTGAICLDILKDKWAAAMSIRTVLLSLQALMAAAEPDDPQDAVVAKQYKESYELFRLTAKHWTAAYAAPTVRDAGTDVVSVWHHTEFDNKIKKLMEVMRVDEHRARVALSSSNWDLERATQALL